MVVDIRVRKSFHIQYNEMQLGKMVERIMGSWDTLWCIYKGQTYYANIDYIELRLLSSDGELFDYVDFKSVHEWVEEVDLSKIASLFTAHKDAIAILVEKPNRDADEMLFVNRVQIAYPSSKIDFDIYLKLKQKGIVTHIVNFPMKLNNVYGTFGLLSLTEQYLQDVNLKNKVIDDLKRITEMSFDDFFAKVQKRLIERSETVQVGEGLRNIFLIGPCVVAGCSPSEETLVDYIYSNLLKLGFSYKIIKIDNRNFSKKILEYDIYQNDIVFFIGSGLKYSDYDMTEILENYNGPQNLCTNDVLHMSKAGCELVAESLVKDIIKGYNDKAVTRDDNKLLHIAEKGQLQCETEYEIKMYLKRTKIHQFLRRGNNGAIVMNANPFTYGHRYLVEYASRNVDTLFVFVVEEDLSFFTYKERLEMVTEGTKDISNVIVLGSGNFVISNKTFYDYFAKEIENEKIIDASKDIYIFARYIAPYFNINKRFVGNEPMDKVTDQYNGQMKDILPYYGCELIEIERLEKDGVIVSGNLVRKALQSGEIDLLKRMLPPSSFQYIELHIETLTKRKIIQKSIENISLCLTDRFLSVVQLVELIKNQKKIVIYGVGRDTNVFLKLLNENEKSKLIFVDQKAEDSKFIFMEKEVFAPAKLKELSSKYYIIIMSSKYYKEMYYECINLEIEKERIKYNTFNLYSFYTSLQLFEKIKIQTHLFIV